MRMRHIVVCGLPFSNIFVHIISQNEWFSKQGNEHKMRVLISSVSFVWNISHSKKTWTRYAK